MSDWNIDRIATTEQIVEDALTSGSVSCQKMVDKTIKKWKCLNSFSCHKEKAKSASIKYEVHKKV